MLCHATHLSKLHIRPSLPVLCVGSFWPCLLQWYCSDRSSTVQHSTGSVQPPSHCSCPLPLCCASYRSVPVQWAAATYLKYSVLVLSLHTALITGNTCKPPLLTSLSFLLLLYQVTLQELCGLELRKEGSVCWANSSLQWITLSLSKICVGKALWLFLFPLLLSPTVSVSQYTGTLSLCWQEALSAVGFSLRRCSFAHVSSFCPVFEYLYSYLKLECRTFVFPPSPLQTFAYDLFVLAFFCFLVLL